jgi:hypothetical protein
MLDDARGSFPQFQGVFPIRHGDSGLARDLCAGVEYPRVAKLPRAKPPWSAWRRRRRPDLPVEFSMLSSGRRISNSRTRG